MSSGSAVKLLMRTAPRMPWAPVITPIQRSFGLADMGSGLEPQSSGVRRGVGLGSGLLGALLGLRLRRRLGQRLGAGLLGDQVGVGQEALDTVRRRGADRQPMLQTLGLQHQALRMILLDHRVVGADPLDETAVARAARVGDDDAVERPLLGAAARQPDLEAHVRSFSFKNLSSYLGEIVRGGRRQ